MIKKILITLLFIPSLLFASSESERRIWQQFSESIASDYQNFYSRESLLYLGGGFAVGGIMANTNIDQGIADWYRTDVRSNSTDDFAKLVKPIGGVYLPIAMYVGGATIGAMTINTGPGRGIAEWSERSIRAVIVGLPPLWLMQRVTGGARPIHNSDDKSHWKPFKKAHGVSGHSFMGAIPFLTAAQMTDDIGYKIPLYIASTFTGWSRINDESHYTSQVLLGWWMAYLATDSVNNSIRERNLMITPKAIPDGIGVQVVWQGG